MTETMRREGHKALVHTAAASNLGQMLTRSCINDGIGLVNIAVMPEPGGDPVKIGATYIVDSTPTFMDRFDQCAGRNSARLWHFDAIGGGSSPARSDLHGYRPQTAKVYTGTDRACTGSSISMAASTRAVD